MLLFKELTPQGPSAYVLVEMKTVLPAGPLERLAVAWARLVPGARQPDPRRSQIGSVGVIGPVGAVRARMTDRSGHVVETSLTNGGGALTLRSPDSQGSVVEFLAADGSVVATAKVVPHLTGATGFGVP